MVDIRTIKTIKVKLNKVIELIVKEQTKNYNSSLCDIQIRLENIYDVLDKQVPKPNGIMDIYIGDGNKKVTTSEHN